VVLNLRPSGHVDIETQFTPKTSQGNAWAFL
jgi:hypothetical protein